MVIYTCSGSYFGGWDGKTAWAWEAEAEVSCDCATVLQPGWKSEILSLKKKKADRLHDNVIISTEILKLFMRGVIFPSINWPEIQGRPMWFKFSWNQELYQMPSFSLFIGFPVGYWDCFLTDFPASIMIFT